MSKLYTLARFLVTVFILDKLILEPSGIIAGIMHSPVDPWYPIILGATLLTALLAST